MAGKGTTSSVTKLRAFELRDQGLALRAIGKELGAGASTIRRWLNDPALAKAAERRAEYDDLDASDLDASFDGEAFGVRVDPDPSGPLGLNPDTERLVGDGLSAGMGMRNAAWLAGLVEGDVAGWFEEAAKRVEPFTSSVRRIRQRVTREQLQVLDLIKGGESGSGFRVDWVKRVDKSWSDKPEDHQTDADRAAGMSSDDLLAVLGMDPPEGWES